jgi:AraC-like DNA-binding protein/mannose-6-phosphate isomerase-like protein (cupin superfamily)
VTYIEPQLQKAKGNIARNIYRPIPAPNINLPYGLRSMGHCRSRIGWQDSPNKKTFVQIFWIVEGVGQFILKENKYLLNPGQCFVYYPGNTHLITTVSDYFEYRFFTIDGLKAEDIVRSFGLLEVPMIVGDCPISEFELLEKEILDVTPFGQAKCAEKAFGLLAKVSGIKKIKNYSIVIEDSIALIERKFHLSALNVNMLSDELKIHRSQLTRQFKKELGITPVEYIISRRIQKGLKLLEESRLTIKEIAILCGYQQPDYFAKAIRRMTGLKPGQLKNKK